MKCQRCFGKGKVKQVFDGIERLGGRYPERGPWWGTCPHCKGTGVEPRKDVNEQIWDEYHWRNGKRHPMDPR